MVRLLRQQIEQYSIPEVRVVGWLMYKSNQECQHGIECRTDPSNPTLLQSSNIDTREGTRLAESTVADMVQFQRLIENVSGKPLAGLRRDIIQEAFEGFPPTSLQFLPAWKVGQRYQGTTQLRLNQQYLSRIPSSIEYMHNGIVESQPSNIYTRIYFKLSQLKAVEMNANQITEIPNPIGQLII